jgi:hypothetical protein
VHTEASALPQCLLHAAAAASAHSSACLSVCLLTARIAYHRFSSRRIADETVGEYLSAGAALGGAGNTFLATEEEIVKHDWGAVQAKASAFVHAVNEWKAAAASASL